MGFWKTGSVYGTGGGWATRRTGPCRPAEVRRGLPGPPPPAPLPGPGGVVVRKRREEGCGGRSRREPRRGGLAGSSRLGDEEHPPRTPPCSSAPPSLLFLTPPPNPPLPHLPPSSSPTRSSRLEKPSPEVPPAPRSPGGRIPGVVCVSRSPSLSQPRGHPPSGVLRPGEKQGWEPREPGEGCVCVLGGGARVFFKLLGMITLLPIHYLGGKWMN